jgi:hypothetical protein
MHVAALIAGIACLWIVLLDAFQTIILPRRATGRFKLTRLFYIATWRPWVYFGRRIASARKRETAFSYFGPLSLIFLLILWAGLMVVGFGFIYYAIGSPFKDVAGQSGFRSDLYVSGTTIFTLGLGDVTPQSAAARAWAFSPWSWATSRCSTARFLGAKSASRCLTRAPARRPRRPSCCAAIHIRAPTNPSPCCS